jgi:hypothetical protein
MLRSSRCQASVRVDVEASLVVKKTPSTLYRYDAFNTTTRSPKAIGLGSQVILTGAAPAN